MKLYVINRLGGHTLVMANSLEWLERLIDLTDVSLMDIAEINLSGDPRILGYTGDYGFIWPEGDI